MNYLEQLETAVVFIENNQINNEEKELLLSINVILIDNFNKNIFEQVIFDNVLPSCNLIEKSETIVNKIINRL